MEQPIRPSKGILLILLLNYPVVEIARMFNVSYQAVYQWRQKYGLTAKYNRTKAHPPCLICGNIFRDTGKERHKYCSDDCCKVKRALSKDRRRQKAREAMKQRHQRPIPPTVQHGKHSTYSNYGCRCDECIKAHADLCAEYRQRRRDKQKQAAPTRR